MSFRADPSERALARGAWVKLICGASNQDLPAITDLCALYASAGVHCVDVAADQAVVIAARQGLDWAEARNGHRPWLMVSVSDGMDTHFRKAWFDAQRCPLDCPRPCERVCPADAISSVGGVLSNRCYGCGRCLPTCPHGLIEAHDQRLSQADVASLLAEVKPDAVEIHTAPGRREAFDAVVASLMHLGLSLRRVAVSCGLEGHGLTIEDLAGELWLRHGCLQAYGLRPLWQLDGRPMSGDVGPGTARAAVSLWQRILPIAPPGPLQLAGGTNSHTDALLSDELRPAGVAFGGMARRLVKPWLLEAEARQVNLRDWPEGWEAALKTVQALVNPWLCR